MLWRSDSFLTDPLCPPSVRWAKPGIRRAVPGQPCHSRRLVIRKCAVLFFRERDRQRCRTISGSVTDRLYYNDSYLTEFPARVVDKSPDGLRIYLDRTAFYPTSGGQPFDIGKLGGVDVIEVVDEDDRIAHQVAAPVQTAEVTGVIDWQRRFDHMQQHTGQHLLSAVLVDLFGAQ